MARGWLLTALIAFIASGFIAALLYYLGQYDYIY